MSQKLLWLFCVSCGLGLSSITWAQTSPDILAYSIPADAIRVKFSTPYPDLNVYKYYARIDDDKRGQLWGKEYYQIDIINGGDGPLVKRELYKTDLTKKLVPNRLNGVVREWYPNGQLKSEEPYRMNVKDGLFRHWDEQGHLIGQYQMTGGNGTYKIYSSEGQLLNETHYLNNRKDGLEFEFYPRTKRVFGWLKQGDYRGTTFDFLGTRIAYMDFRDFKGDLHGPDLRFDLRNAEQKAHPDLGNGLAYAGESRKWYIKNREVTEEAYAKAAALDKTLPPYFADLEQYKQFVTPEVTALLNKYIALPRVKIPLEFDAKGEPLPAPPDQPPTTDKDKPAGF